MITENPLREKNRHVDDGPINLPTEITLGDLYVSNITTTDEFTDPVNPHHKINNSPKKDLEPSELFTTIIPTCLNPISILMELPLKIMNGVSDLLNFQSHNSPDSEIPFKRPYSPRPHHNMKQTPTDIARGRGRGRGRSQLRRSGVSQTRHRQERIRQRVTADIQDDLKGLKEFDDLKDSVDDMPCVDENGIRILYGADGVETESTGSSRFPYFFGYCDVMKRRKRKQQKNGNRDRMSITNNCKVRYIPECPVDIIGGRKRRDDDDNDIVEEVQSDDRINRKRLQSDRSVDSEDSCCIVFETGSESEYETDYDYTTTDDEDEDCDDDDTGCGSKLKVRFSPHPKIHTIIAWDYAYRAARRGPWEEMARDRERFKSRIICIARVLDPILVPQHRSEIWQHRFAVEI